MLKAHFDAIEKSLLHTSQVPANAGHTLHRGTPRENLISLFLQSHLSANVAIGSGEVIDHSSKPRESRNQFDIVIYRNNYPKLDFGGVNGFLVESVIATIEVKSLLDESGIEQATRAAANLKKLEPRRTRYMAGGWVPPKPLSFVVAYAGPATMATVHGLVQKARAKLGIPDDTWGANDRLASAGNALDGVCVLGLGGSFLCNTPMFPPNIPAIARSCAFTGNALMFQFLTLQHACVGMEYSDVHFGDYLQGHAANGTIYTSEPPPPGMERWSS